MEPEDLYKEINKGEEKKRKMKRMGIIAAVIILLVGGGFTMGYLYVKKGWSLDSLLDTLSGNCVREGKNLVGYGRMDEYKPCCEGLNPISFAAPRNVNRREYYKDLWKYPIEDFEVGDTICDAAPPDNKGGFICAKCGNGKCGKGENVCNCPKDCYKGE